LNAGVNALERLQIVRARNSSYFGSNPETDLRAAYVALLQLLVRSNPAHRDKASIRGREDAEVCPRNNTAIQFAKSGCGELGPTVEVAHSSGFGYPSMRAVGNGRSCRCEACWRDNFRGRGLAQCQTPLDQDVVSDWLMLPKGLDKLSDASFVEESIGSFLRFSRRSDTMNLVSPLLG